MVTSSGGSSDRSLKEGSVGSFCWSAT